MQVPLIQRIVRALPVLAGAMLFSLVISREGVFRRFEAKALDLESQLRPPWQSDVALVLITDDDYRRWFRGESPLDPLRLQRLISAVAAAQPRLIAVDIDTSAPVFRGLEAPGDGPPVVWGQAAAYSNRSRSFHAPEVLGGRGAAHVGLMAFQVDEDGAVRRYHRALPTGQGLRPTFPWSIALAFHRKQNAAHDLSAARLIDYRLTPGRTLISAAQVFRLANEKGWKFDGPLRDKIVLIGGDYAAQDEHETPIGWMLGSEILAQAVDTELHNTGEKVVDSWLLFSLQLLGGLLLLLVFHSFRLLRALFLSIVILPVLAFASSFFAFWTFSRGGYFVPFLAGVVFQELYLGAWDYRKHLVAVASRHITEPGPASTEA